MTKSIRLILPQHILKHHKEDMNVFRAWFCAKYFLDPTGSGMVDFHKLCRLTKLTPKYLKEICRNTIYIKAITQNKVYYTSEKKILNKHRLLIPGTYIRGENMTKRLKEIVRSNKLFRGRILRWYAESDRDFSRNIKGRYTKGRIGHESMALEFKLSRKTVLENIKASNARYYPNTKSYKNIRFEDFQDFCSWLTQNMGSRLDGHLIENNPKSYFMEPDIRGGFYLIQKLPAIYKFTGVYLVRARRPRGNAKASSEKCAPCSHEISAGVTE